MGEDRCPQCGAPVARVDEPRILDCAHCGARLWVESAARVDEWVAPALSEAEAVARLLAELSDRECAGRPRAVPQRLVFLPFWQRAATPGLRLAPAQPELATETEGWHVGGADRLPLDPAALERRGALRVATLEPPEHGMSLLFVPFWEIDYAVGPESYRAWVEAVSGGVVSTRDPPTREGRLDLAYGGLLALVALVLAVGFRLAWAGGAAAAAGAALLVAAGLLAPRAGRALVRRVEGEG